MTNHPNIRSRRKGGAFTLVEMLVVIVILAVIASLLLPVLSRARSRATTAHCVSNLRQFGIALANYVAQEEVYPLSTAGDGLGQWQKELAPFVTRDLFRCPQKAAPSDQYKNVFKSSPPFIYPHYGYNYMGAVRRNPPAENLGLGGDYVLESGLLKFTPVPEHKIVSPSEMIAMGDSPAFIYVGFGKPPPDPAAVLYITFPYVVPALGRPGVGDSHDGSANMLFCDGHVELAKESKWIEASTVARQLWNNDKKPHEECW